MTNPQKEIKKLKIENSRLPKTYEGSPPPQVVLCRQLEIGQCDGHGSSHTQQDNKHNKQDSVQSVRLTTPQCRENVIQFH